MSSLIPILTSTNQLTSRPRSLATMVLGKAGMRLEAYKFGLYISVPILASIIFNEPEVQRKCADYFQFLKVR